MDTTGSSCLILVSILATARSEIIKPWREWLCNYCSMGESVQRRRFQVLISVLLQRPQGTTPSAGLRYCVSSTGCCYSSSSSPSTQPSKEPENNLIISQGSSGSCGVLQIRLQLYSGENRSSLLCLIDLRLRII